MSHRFNILHFDEISSTHEYVKVHFKELPDQQIVTTDYQTHGRGRLGRVWQSPKKSSLLMSILLKEHIDNPSVISMLISIALSRTFNFFSLKAGLIWPNDVYVNQSKIAGILTEAIYDKGKIKGVVLSLGLNLFQDKSELELIDKKATSLFNEGIKNITINQLRDKFVETFFQIHKKFINKGFKDFRDEYNSLLLIKGKIIEIDFGKKKIKAEAREIDTHGHLVIKTENGISTISSGEIIKIAVSRKG